MSPLERGRPCRIPGCTKTACPRRTVCITHRNRIHRHGDPHHHEWQTADPNDIEIAAHDRTLHPGMTRLERRLLGLRFTALGLPAAEIARILGVAPRTIHRWRAADRTRATTAA